MNIVSVTQLFKTYGDKVLLKDVSFGIGEHDRVGLIGVNGAGKSTLLNILAGIDFPESGTVVLGGRVIVHYLPQNPVLDPDRTVIDEVFAGDLPVMRLLRDYQMTLLELAASPTDEASQRRLLSLQNQFDAQQAWQLEHEAKNILTRLGVAEFDRKVGELSGGQRKRVAMARALIQQADLLILDEPTNHIDDATVAWLERYLQSRKGALMMVTHDRYFLDRVANRIFELDRGRLFEYDGNYETFLEGKLAREASERATEDKRQNFLRSEIEWIQKGPRARGTKQKARTERYYELLEDGPGEKSGQMQMATASTRLGKSVIQLDHVTKGYANEVLIRDFSTLVNPTDRIGIIGANGRGKSTLLRMMAGQLEPDGGEVHIGETVRMGYYGQEHDWTSHEDVRVIDYIQAVAMTVETGDGETVTASQMLERFLFPGSLQWTPIAKLSGGERRRLALLRILVTRPNVLLLDEPTNDLDIPTLQVLEAYLDEFPGVVVSVSHDRYFLDRVANSILAFRGGGEIVKRTGNFSDYLAYEADMDATTGALGGVIETSPSKSNLTPDSESVRTHQRRGKRMTYQERREYERIDEDIATAEEEGKRIERDMAECASDHVRLQALFIEQQVNEEKLLELLERWTYLTELAEEIENEST